DLAVRGGQGRHELGLRPVRVLELVDEDVSIAPGDRVTGGRRLPDEPEGEGDLVAEVDEAVARQEFLVPGVGTRELDLLRSLLGGRAGRIRAAGGRDGGGLRCESRR